MIEHVLPMQDPNQKRKTQYCCINKGTTNVHLPRSDWEPNICGWRKSSWSTFKLGKQKRVNRGADNLQAKKLETRKLQRTISVFNVSTVSNRSPFHIIKCNRFKMITSVVCYVKTAGWFQNNGKAKELWALQGDILVLTTVVPLMCTTKK